MPVTSRPSNYYLRSSSERREVQREEQLEQDYQVSVQTNPTSFSNMASGMFRLEQFKGDGSQKIESYLRRFDQYKTCTGINNKQALATLAWHLDGNARLWFEQLNPEPSTLDELKDALQDKFHKDEAINMSIYCMRQKSGESVEDFLCRLECETFKTGISENIQVQIALNGMDRAIGTALSTHVPKTLDELKKLTSRMGSIRHSDTSVAQASTIPSKLESTVDVLTAAVAKLAASVEQTRPKQQAQQECRRCGGRCFLSASCKAMGKTCYKCNKMNHFGNKCRSGKGDESQTTRQRQRQVYEPPFSQQRQYNNYRQ